MNSPVEGSQTWKLLGVPDDHSSDAVPGGVIGKLIKLSLPLDLPLIVNAVDPFAVEHYRRLRTRILQQQILKGFKTLVVTSPSPQEGKTLTVLNLGLSFALMPNFKVLVIDGDIRRGSLGQLLGADDLLGFSNLIDNTARIEDVVMRAKDFPLYFMGRGTSIVAPGELLQSYEFKSKLRKLAEHFSLILIDSPPANLISDVQHIAENSDAVLLVARAFTTTRKTFQKTLQDVSGFPVIGTVLNGLSRPESSRKYRGYYNYRGKESGPKLLTEA